MSYLLEVPTLLFGTLVTHSIIAQFMNRVIDTYYAYILVIPVYATAPNDLHTRCSMFKKAYHHAELKRGVPA